VKLVSALIAMICLATVAAPPSLADDAVVLYFLERPPLFVKDGDRVGGVFGDAAERVFQVAGLPFVWREEPFVRQLREFKRGEVAVCLPGAYKTPDREEYALFTAPLLRPRPVAVLARNNDPRLDLLPDFDALISAPDLTLVVKTGYSYGTRLDAMIATAPGGRRNTTSENTEMATQIAAGRGDYMLLPPEEGGYLIETTARSRLRLVDIPGTPLGSARHIMCSRAVPMSVIDRLNAAITGASNRPIPTGSS